MMLPPEILKQSINDSVHSLITISLPISRSKNFSAALNIASQANNLFEINIDKSIFYIASFGKSITQASLAIALINISQTWKGVHYFIKGQHLSNIYKITSILECYQQSMRCNDHKAYCYTLHKNVGQPKNRTPSFKVEVTISHPLNKILPNEEVIEETWIHPCKKLSYYVQHLNNEHTSSLQDQLQAQGVENYCDICPNFNSNNLKIIKINGHHVVN